MKLPASSAVSLTIVLPGVGGDDRNGDHDETAGAPDILHEELLELDVPVNQATSKCNPTQNHVTHMSRQIQSPTPLTNSGTQYHRLSAAVSAFCNSQTVMVKDSTLCNSIEILTITSSRILCSSVVPAPGSFSLAGPIPPETKNCNFITL